MKKFVCTKTNEEVRMGDVRSIGRYEQGHIIITEVLTFSEENLTEYIRNGILIEVVSYGDIINHMAARTSYGKWNINDLIGDLYKLHSCSVYQLLLKEIAIIFDENYPDHVSSSKEIWAINSINKEVIKLNPDRIKSFKNFAAFRSYNEAANAKKILESIIDEE